jgi:hypothetical protein
MPRARPRGLAGWNPTAGFRELVEAVFVVLDEYEEQLPFSTSSSTSRLWRASANSAASC